MTDRICCAPNWSWNSIASGWNGYHIWCVEGGHTDVKVKEEEYRLYQGDIFLFDLNYNHICTHNPLQPLKVSTVYFDIPELKYQKRVIRQNPFWVEIVHRLITCYEQEEKVNAYIWLKALLIEFVKVEKEQMMRSAVVRDACALMEEKIFEPLALGEVSREVGYSKNQLIRLFQKELGCTPMQYYTQKKMDYAKGQLLYSNQTLQEISNILGFCDVSYFGKVFKSQVGCSPGCYRDNVKK